MVLTEFKVERMFEGSHTRRGRLATAPTWFVTHDSRRWRFTRKKDATAFVERGGCSHAPTGSWCAECRAGFEIVVPVPRSIARGA